jgi:hypothetical protein
MPPGPATGNSMRPAETLCSYFIVSVSSPEALAGIERMLGISGKKITMPSILGRPAIDLPLLYVASLVILLYVGGPRAILPLVAIGYFLATSTRQRN